MNHEFRKIQPKMYGFIQKRITKDYEIFKAYELLLNFILCVSCSCQPTQVFETSSSTRFMGKTVNARLEPITNILFLKFLKFYGFRTFFYRFMKFWRCMNLNRFVNKYIREVYTSLEIRFEIRISNRWSFIWMNHNERFMNHNTICSRINLKKTEE